MRTCVPATLTSSTTMARSMSSVSAPNSHTGVRQGSGPTWKATKKSGRGAISGVDPGRLSQCRMRDPDVPDPNSAFAEFAGTAPYVKPPRPRQRQAGRGVCRHDRVTTTTGHRDACPAPVRLDVAIHERLLAAVGSRRGVDAADRLCEACVVLFDVDAAAISLVFDGANSGTLGSSG